MKKSTILTCFSAIGVVGTAILAAKEAPKAAKLCEMEEKKKLHPTKYDYFKACWKCYIPAAAVGTATIVCIFGTNTLNQRQQATLVSAYGLLNESYKKYKDKVKETYGEEAHQEIMRKIVMDKTSNDAPYAQGLCSDCCLDFSKDEDVHLFYDEYSGEYFESTFSRVLQAEYHLNRNFMLRGVISLNEFYDFLGLDEIKKKVKCGDAVGWSNVNGDIYWIDFDHTRTVLDDNLVCYTVEMVFNPEPDYADY